MTGFHREIPAVKLWRTSHSGCRYASKALVGLIAVVSIFLSHSSMVGAHSTKQVLRELQQQVPYMQLTDRAAPAFVMEDADGHKVSLADLKGSVVVFNFVYMRCTDACPLHMSLVGQIQEQVNATLMREHVRFVTIATDTEPAAETAEIMGSYGKAHGLDPTNWRILHGGSAKPGKGIEVAKTYGLEFTPTPDGQQMHGVVTHVIDANGVLRARFHGLKFPALSVTSFINTLLYPDHHATGAEAMPAMNAGAPAKQDSHALATLISIWLWPVLAVLMFGAALLATRGAGRTSPDTESSGKKNSVCLGEPPRERDIGVWQPVMNSGPMRARWPWYRERSVWRFIALRFAPWLAVLNLLWEIAQLPLYTIWYDAGWDDIVFAVAHCTAGDLLIGTFALMLALTATGSGSLTAWRTVRVAAVTIALSVSYTVFSEWMNTTVHDGWAYSHLMPLLPGLGTGLAPLLQWAVIPPVALYAALRLVGARRCPSTSRLA